MPDMLDAFIEKAKESLGEGYYERKNVAAVDAKKLSLRKTLDENTFSVISEIKHASPAGEYSFREIDTGAAAIGFRESGADGISVVVEPKVFMGSIGNVPLAKKACLPVIFKDFVFDETQIVAAANSGADAVLLVVKVARRTNADLHQLIRAAHRKGLEVLLESYDAGEMRSALDTEADVLGINNRDLQTLEVDISRTREVLQEVGRVDRPVVSESGIKSATHAAFVKQCGAKGILVGTALWASKEPAAKIRELKEGGLNA